MQWAKEQGPRHERPSTGAHAKFMLGEGSFRRELADLEGVPAVKTGRAGEPESDVSRGGRSAPPGTAPVHDLRLRPASSGLSLIRGHSSYGHREILLAGQC